MQTLGITLIFFFFSQSTLLMENTTLAVDYVSNRFFLLKLSRHLETACPCLHLVVWFPVGCS
jgi:hypothetical protein